MSLWGWKEIWVSIGFYLMTEKGLKVLESVIHTLGSDEIEYVVGAADDSVASDSWMKSPLCAASMTSHTPTARTRFSRRLSITSPSPGAG